MAAGAFLLVGRGLLPAAAATPPAAIAACFTTAVNGARVAAGVPPLAPDVRLTALATVHAQTMQDRGRIFHNTTLPDQAPASWTTVGENVGTGPSCDAIAKAFMASKEHRANILDPTFGSLGVGVSVSGRGTIFVTEDFMGLS